MQKRKVLIVISSLKFGGAEKQTIELINRLDTSKFQVFLCCLKKEEHLKDQLKREQLSSLLFLNKRRRIDLNVLAGLKSLVKKTEPEILLCVDPYPAFYAHMLRFFFGSKFRLIQVLHATIMLNVYNDMIVHFLYKRLINRCNNIVFVCKNQMDYWVRNYSINKNLSTYIYNGIDIDRFNYKMSSHEKIRMQESFGIMPSDTVIGICAALRKEKKHEDLIEAGRILIEKGHPIKILIIGDGPEKNNIQKHIKHHNMTGNVFITGFKKDVRPYIYLSDIITVTSIAVETFSMALLEAMAMGKAIVASDIGGASEQILNSENGFLFPPGDINALAESLEAIITKNLFEEMGKKSLLLVKKKYTVERMVKEYQGILLQ